MLKKAQQLRNIFTETLIQSIQNRMILFFVSRESVLPVSKRKTDGLLLPLRSPLTMLVLLNASVQQVRHGHAPMHSQL